MDSTFKIGDRVVTRTGAYREGTVIGFGEDHFLLLIKWDDGFDGYAHRQTLWTR
jgi:hypothetical protein